MRGRGASIKQWAARDPMVQALTEAWLEALNFAAQHRIAAELQGKALEQVPYLPTGQYLDRTACRQNITGIIPGQCVFWNSRRT